MHSKRESTQCGIFIPNSFSTFVLSRTLYCGLFAFVLYSLVVVGSMYDFLYEPKLKLTSHVPPFLIGSYGPKCE